MLHHHRLTHAGDARAHVRARRRGSSLTGSGKSAYYMVKVLLALFVGLARRRPIPEPGDRSRPVAAEAATRPGPVDARIQFLVDRRRDAGCSSSCWSWCAAAACSSATRCCGWRGASCCSCWPSWRGLLEKVADTVGIAYPPNALFFLAFAAILVLLLHFSAAVSRLADQSKMLAQRLALVEERLRKQEARGEGADAEPEDLLVGSESRRG